MSTLLRRRKTCRLCGSANLSAAISLTPTPPANDFVAAAARGVQQECFPLNVYFCEDCTHIQLLDVVDARSMFEHYVYVSGTSPSFVRHFEDYAEFVVRLSGMKPEALVIDIGSNDGTLLRAFKERYGAKVLGIDPARNLAEAATAAGIETLPEFFSPVVAKKLAVDRGHAAIITANNVFAHIDDLGGIVEGIRTLLAPDGLFVFEVSYLLDVVQKILFDTIYHEHLSYHAVRPLIGFLERHGLELIETIRVPTHGGSLRGVAQLKGGPRPCGKSIAELLQLERGCRLENLSTYTAMSERINTLGVKLRALLKDLRDQGMSVAGFGAPAKATTLMYHFGIAPEYLEFIVDDSPLKQGLFSPGLHIPILPAEAIVERKPDYLLILAWNFAEQIIDKNAAFRKRGGRFIVPVPNLEVI